MTAETIRYVRATGDTTGAADTARIQAALDDSSVKSVVLEGLYYVTGTITVTGKSLIGAHYARITRVGTADDTYLIKCDGSGYVIDTYLQGIQLYCATKCRGLWMYYCSGREILRNVRVYNAVSVGLELTDCWGSNMHDVTVGSCRGISVRMHRCNSFLATNTYIYSAYCMRCDVSAQTQTMIEYACDNGIDEAKLRYDGTDPYGTYTEDWPAESDETVTDSDSNAVQTTDTERAVMVLGNDDAAGEMDSTTFINLVFEPTYCADYPVISLKSSNTRFMNVRFENHYGREEMVLVDGDGQRHGTHIVFDGCYLAADKESKYFVRATNTVSSITLRDIAVFEYITDNIVAVDGGLLSRLTVDNVRLTANTLLSFYVAELNSGTFAGSRPNRFNTILGDSVIVGRPLVYQPAPAAIADGNTAITADNMLTRLMTMASSTTGRAPTVPTGTAVYGVIPIDQSLDWTFINTGDQTVTITQATGHTLVGGMALAAGTQGMFRTRCSAANTAITYRLA